MIQVTQIIKYLRDNLQNIRVDGCAELAKAKDDSRLMMENGFSFVPTVFVMLGDVTCTTMSKESFLLQYEAKFSIIACINNTDDRTGKSAQQYVYNMRLALFALLLNWKSDDDSHNIEYVGDTMIDMDRARYWHRFDFKKVGWLNESDGVPEALGVFNELNAQWMSQDSAITEPIMRDVISPLYFIPD